MDGQQFKAPFQGLWVLDKRDPYEGHSWPTGPTPGSTGDSPSNDLNDPNIRVSGLNDSFQTYLMFRPPGIGSSWVPLQLDTWDFYIEVARAGTTWRNLGTSTQSNSGFSQYTVQPQWTNVLPSPFSQIPI